MALRRLAATLAVPALLLGTGLLPVGSGGPARAATPACTAGIHPTSITTAHARRPRVATGRILLRAAPHAPRARRWRATVVLTGLFGTATATVADTVCTGDVTGRALSWSYRGAGSGVLTRAVVARAASKVAARSRLHGRVGPAKRQLARLAQRHGIARASAAALASATARARALSHVVYLSGNDDSKTASATPLPAGPRLTQSGGVTSIAFPPAYDGSEACLTRAATWTPTYLVDAGSKRDGVVVAGAATLGFSDTDALAAGVADGATPTVRAYVRTLVGGSTVAHAQLAWSWQWADDGTGTAVGSGTFSDALAAGMLVCFGGVQLPPGTVTIRGLRVASGVRRDEAATPVVDTLVRPLRVAVG